MGNAIQSSVSSAGADTDDTALNRLVQQLMVLRDQGKLQVALKTGELIVDSLFGGDIERWRRRGRTDRSFARLLTHRELPMCATDLRRAVRAFDLALRIPSLSTSKRVTMGHLDVLLTLDTCQQRQLLARVEAERWSIQKLTREIAIQRVRPPRTGRPRGAPVVATLRRLGHPSAFDGKAELASLNPVALAELLPLCERIHEEVGTVAEILRAANDRHVTARRTCRSARILLVHGDPSFTARARRCLNKHGYSVCIARSAANAELLVNEPADYVVIAHRLPDGDGSAVGERFGRCRPEAFYILLVDPKDEQPADDVSEACVRAYQDTGLKHLRRILAHFQMRKLGGGVHSGAPVVSQS